jgi:hypothetical protein
MCLCRAKTRTSGSASAYQHFVQAIQPFLSKIFNQKRSIKTTVEMKVKPEEAG